MDINQYHNFITIAEAKTITAAASKLCIAQPALSNQLKALEAEYGAALVETGRGIREIKLTEAGQIFYKQAKNICQLEENLRKDIQDCVQGVSGTLKISLSSSRSKILINNMIKSFIKGYPQVKFHLFEGTIIEQEEHVLSGLSEIAIAHAPITRPELFDCLYRRKEWLYAVASSAEMLPAKEQLQMSDLVGLPLCVSYGCHIMLKPKMQEANLTYNPLSISGSRQTTVEWARAGLGVAIIPAESTDIPYEDLVYKRIDNHELYVYKTIFKAKNKQLSKLAQQFLQHYEERCYPGTEKNTSNSL